MGARKVGRPRVSSREVIAEAACELFLERGFEAVSISDIAQRAGVSRSSFFNYASSKSGLLWMPVDEAIGSWTVESFGSRDHPSAAFDALQQLGSGLGASALTLVLAQVEAMGMAEEADREATARQIRIARVLARATKSQGTSAIEADVAGHAWAGAFIVALRLWAHRGAATASFSVALDEAFGALSAAPRSERVSVPHDHR